MINLTKNNHSSMKTEVETFIIEETQELIYDNEQLDKWNEHVEALGLVGQKQIVKPDKSPIPFMHLKQSMINIFECLCPMQVKVEQYNITPIPVEILDLIALSKKENYFTSIEIWYDEKSPDPVCVGIVKRFGEWNNYNWNTQAEASAALGKAVSDYSYQKTMYLLGKWADVKHSFEELKKMAIKRYTENEKNELNGKIKKAKRELDDLEQTAFEKFN